MVVVAIDTATNGKMGVIIGSMTITASDYHYFSWGVILVTIDTAKGLLMGSASGNIGVTGNTIVRICCRRNKCRQRQVMIVARSTAITIHLLTVSFVTRKTIKSIGMVTVAFITRLLDVATLTRHKIFTSLLMTKDTFVSIKTCHGDRWNRIVSRVAT